MSKAEDILLFDFVFSILLIAFGTQLGVNPSFFQALQTPKLAPLPSGTIATCQNTDAGCIAQNLTVATSYIGWAVVNLPVLIIFFTQIIFLFGNQVLAVTFSPALSPNGIPFLGLFMTGLQLYIVWEIIRTVRGSSTGV